jgi:hypothetical protein
MRDQFATLLLLAEFEGLSLMGGNFTLDEIILNVSAHINWVVVGKEKL